MKKESGAIIYSPTDLIRYLASPFASWLDRYNVENLGVIPPDDETEEEKLFSKAGSEHEAAILSSFKISGQNVVEISRQDPAAHAKTIAAVQGKAPIIFQAALQDGVFAGYADFLILGGGAKYQVWDTKLALSPKPYYPIQLCCYSEMLAATTEKAMPERIGIILGDGDRIEFRVEDFIHYYRHIKNSFIAMHAAFSGDINDCPEPLTRADHGRWTSHAEKLFLEKDHLVQVAGITVGQMKKLRLAGIATMTALGTAAGESVPRLDRGTLEKLASQARLQSETRNDRRTNPNAKPRCELLSQKSLNGEAVGLAALPPAHPADVFFDMEGYPLIPGGLEYLFGVCERAQTTSVMEFRDWWAHDRDQEKLTFERFIDWVFTRWKKNPKMHIYHYAAYEVSARISNIADQMVVLYFWLAKSADMKLLERLYKRVKEDSGHKGGYYASKLGDVTRKQVNRCLYSNACFFNFSETDRPAWKVIGRLTPIQPPWTRSRRRVPPPPIAAIEQAEAVEVPDKISADAGEHLSGWQKLAYKNWVNRGRRGIVEAVTGAGKTRLGIAAIKEAVAMNRRSVVVVPSIVLQQQWHRGLKAIFPHVNVGLFGGPNHRQTSAEVTVAVVHTLARDAAKSDAHFKNTYLLVADEVHRYGAPTFAQGLLPCAGVRLGLTATLERTDDGVKEVLLPYFRNTVYNCNFEEARTAGRLAFATIALLGIVFNEEEQEAYDDASRKARHAKSKLVRDHYEQLCRYGFKNNDTDLFFVAAQRLAEVNDTPGKLARTWLSARSDASDILANATGKRTAARSLSYLFGNGHSGIVFCQRIAAADELSRLFAQQQLRSAALHSDFAPNERQLMLQKLSDGRLDLLTTATALDEGIDVPNIDTGIIISSTQQKRQMIQRLGRVLRTKPDGRRARVVITYALGTWEDPAVNPRRAEFAKFAADAAGGSGAYKDFKQEWDVEKALEFFAD